MGRCGRTYLSFVKTEERNAEQTRLMVADKIQ